MNFKKILKTPFVWSFTSYFAQGFPYTITRSVIPVFLRDKLVSLESIGLTSLYGLPWILKFLWAPQIDKSLTKKKWLVLMQSIISFFIICSSFLIPLESSIFYISITFFIVAFFSATNDVAIDGYYMAALDKNGQAKFVGYRVMAYRIAMITGTGLIVTLGTTTSWTLAFFIAGVLMCLISIFHFIFLDEVEENQKSFLSILKNIIKLKNMIFISAVTYSIFLIRQVLKSESFNNLKLSYPILSKIYFSHVIGIFLLIFLLIIYLFRKKIYNFLNKDKDSFYSKAFLSYIDRPHITIILFFILTLRTGEWMLSTMLSPFIVDLGIKVHYGWLSSGIGLPASIIGAMIGGWAIYKYGMKKVIWPFIIAQNFTNVIYAVLAYLLQNYISINTGVDTPTPIGAFNISMVAGVMAFDQFSGGLGTSVLMIYLIRLCLSEYKATHYAIGSGLMSVTGMFAGILGGLIAGSYGYAWTYLISFFVSLPAMIIVPFLPDIKE